MAQEVYRVTVNNITKEYPAGTPYGVIAKDYEQDYDNPLVLALVNGRLREFHKTLKKDCDISFVTTGDSIGHKTYKRSTSLLLLKAIYHIVGRENIEKVVLHYSVGAGFYYTIRGNVTITEELLQKIKKYMLELVEQKIPIMKRSISTHDAVELFHKYGMYDKEKLFRYRRVSKVNIYSLGDFEDYFYGFMVWHTGYLKYFDLIPYDEGLVLQMPTVENPQELPPFQAQPKLFQVQKQSEKWGEMLNVDTVGDLNECITRESMRELILIQEALQEGELSHMAETIESRKGVKFVMIAGPSSSGKTTFSHRLSIQLSAHGMKPHPIAVDNYFVDRDKTPLDEMGNKNYECLEAIDVEQFNKDMNALLRGERIELPEYNFKTGKREYKGNYLQLGQDDILVIEGIHCLNDKLSYTLPKESKFKIYISAVTQLNIDEHNRIPTTDGRLIRRMVRDNRTRGTSAKDTIHMWYSVRRGEEENIFPYQESADVMFNSALIYELSILKSYAEPVLFQIQESEPEYKEAKRLLKFLDYFVGVPSEDVPHNSFLREFIGGGCFDV
ncbi:MAG: nucleoside kinase [Lachnospiraceae bacterium]|nr:nucleoside kinase [Lachnospiraceae bacterium]MDD3614636.1 nucleoside kinase [Lachnospiraceae bacterium]